MLAERLGAAMSGARVEIEDDSAAHAGHAGNRGGGHFHVRIAWAGFTAMSRLERQRHVNALVADMFADGRIHALSLELGT